MNCTIKEYLEDAKSQLCVNQMGPVDYITYNYTNELIEQNKEYFEYCLGQDLSAYKALLFFHDYLSGDWYIKPYTMVTKNE